MTAEDTLIRTLDRRILIPILAAYCCSYVDRSNISSSLTSLERSIGLTPADYALSAALFTFSLVLVEIPSNALLKRYGAKLWLTGLIAGCGACTILQGLVVEWRELVFVRTVLGVFEGGVFPGALFALTLYYPQEYLTVRIASFTLAASFAFALGSFLAGVILPLGDESWRALFLIQGIATICISTFLYSSLPTSPSTIDLPIALQTAYQTLLSKTSTPPLPPSYSSGRSRSPDRGSRRSRSPPPPTSPERTTRLESSTPLLLHTPTREYPPSLLPSSLDDRFAPPSHSAQIVPTLKSPLTWFLSLAYFLLLLGTTPSAFLPRILQSRWAVSEGRSNVVVGSVYFLGGFVQFFVGWLGSRISSPAVGGGGGREEEEDKGESRLMVVWRWTGAMVVLSWMTVSIWEVYMGGEGVRGVEGGWEWVGGGGERFVGIGLRLVATMATPTLGSLYLSHTVSLPSTVVPNRAILTACVISVGNLAQAVGPTLYAACLPPLPSLNLPPVLPSPPPSLAGQVDGYSNWRELARTDFFMGLGVAVAGGVVEGVRRWAGRWQKEREGERVGG